MYAVAGNFKLEKWQIGAFDGFFENSQDVVAVLAREEEEIALRGDVGEKSLDVGSLVALDHPDLVLGEERGVAESGEGLDKCFICCNDIGYVASRCWFIANQVLAQNGEGGVDAVLVEVARVFEHEASRRARVERLVETLRYVVAFQRLESVRV